MQRSFYTHRQYVTRRDAMLIVMSHDATDSDIEAVVDTITQSGFSARAIKGGARVAIGVLHNPGAVDAYKFLSLQGVKEVIPVTKPYKLVSREFQPENTVVRIGDIKIGGDELVMIAGPCAVESEEQALATARAVKEAGAKLYRGGAFKPRTSPYAFQGLGEEGLKILAKVRAETGLPVVTEAIDHENIDMVAEYADVVQIGARNMQNFSLLKKAGRIGRPILLKRGISATVDEWLMAAEYIMEAGNSNIVLCERGVRTFADHSRNTLDISAIPVVQKESHLPVIVDPSHAAGRRDQVQQLGCAAVAAGAKGLIVEVHYRPDSALSDGAQSLYPGQFKELYQRACRIFDICRSPLDQLKQ
jgi:3-deoxy-7-phosphoheptulonate synthase